MNWSNIKQWPHIVNNVAQLKDWPKSTFYEKALTIIKQGDTTKGRLIEPELFELEWENKDIILYNLIKFLWTNK